MHNHDNVHVAGINWLARKLQNAKDESLEAVGVAYVICYRLDAFNLVCQQQS